MNVNKKPKVACIFNYASHYNYPLYSLMDKELPIDFYFGDVVKGNIKKFDVTLLAGFKKELHTLFIGHLNYLAGGLGLIFKYDKFVITGEPYCISSWLILLISRLTGKKVYLWTHGWYGRESKIKRLLKYIYFSLGTKVLLYGNYARNLMIAEGFNPSKLNVIYNSLAYDDQLDVRQKLKPSEIYFNHFNNSNKVLFFIGRLIKDKKLSILLDAVFELKKSGVNCNVVLIGEGEDTLYLKQMADNLGICEQVWFYGACYDEEEIGKLIFNADLCVTPGAIGLTAIHSLTYGTPVVTHNDFKYHGPEFEAIQDGITGGFFMKDDLNDLSKTIDVWIQKTTLNRESIREKCYEIIDEYYNPHFQVKLLNELLFV